MSRARTNATPPPPAPEAGMPTAYKAMIWLLFFANSIFLIYNCLDRYLAPRFLFASAALSVLVVWLWRELRTTKHTTAWVGLDLALLGWYLLNVAAVTWSMSVSEGMFYAQKTLILFGAYWLMRLGWARYEAELGRILARATIALTWVTSGTLLIQIGMALQESGLDNEALYAWTSGLSGNKGLASDTLFLLLIFTGLSWRHLPNRLLGWIHTGLLLGLILVLQTRTVYLAVIAAGAVYAIARATTDPIFQRTLLRRILPATLVVAGAGAAFLSIKGRGTSLAERLNPATYLESASANERRFVWYKTGLLCDDHPLLGVGNGSWKFWLPSKSLQGAYRLQERGVVFTRVHNDYLEVRAEMGWVGFACFIGLFVLAGWYLWRGLRHPDTATRDLAAWVLAGLTGYCVIQFFDFPRERIEIQIMLAFLLGLAAHTGRTKPNVEMSPSPASTTSHWHTAILSLLCIGMLFNCWIGYHRANGEIHNLRMAKAYARNDHATTIREARLAQNAWYEYNDVALPLQWFEGVAQFKQKNLPASIATLAEALRLNQWSFQVLNNYASALAATERYREAIPIFRRAVEINPKYDEGKFNLAFSYHHLQQRDSALYWLQQVDTIPNPKTDDERVKNRTIQENKATFEKVIQGR
jgi:O-antigen ligase